MEIKKGQDYLLLHEGIAAGSISDQSSREGLTAIEWNNFLTPSGFQCDNLSIECVNFIVKSLLTVCDGLTIEPVNSIHDPA